MRVEEAPENFDWTVWLRDLKFHSKPAIEFFNVSGVYQMVDPEMEPFIKMHEELHRSFSDGYR